MSSSLTAITGMNKLVTPNLKAIEQKKYEDLDEVEKMCLGMPYSIHQQELIDGRAFAKTKCFELNRMNPVDPVNHLSISFIF